MLEIKNVTRRYTPKKGVPVVALDDLSVKFPEKGMVFLLGKSGSGKSTLLNVMGGLDKYDAGEIIIKGKSSKNFTQGDFDSYRNTYLGFIFQEYNILNEFSVGANIGLALQLQGKKATDKAINDILEEVDLAGYGVRKPNELSGGQKQRVAIARALVKNPEIILADEPTGALDSNTGLQVFDTLKKLSQDKLVIVVTHDREFAELYGDRVIELKDGKIIDDIEKFKAQGDKRNESINVIDNKIIQIKKGYTLTKEDLEFINGYIAKQDAIISIDPKSNTDLKKFARIDTDGNREAFQNTDESKIVIPDDKNFKLIKSRLPFKNSFKIGASSLKNKPLRLAFTILLSVVAFAMFGLTDTMASYNKYKTTETSIIDSNINALSISKTKVYEDSNYYNKTEVNSADSDITYLKDKIGIDFKPVYTPLVNSYNSLNYSQTFNKSLSHGGMFTATMGGFYETTAEDLANLGFTISGRLPTAFDEVAISEYAYRHFKEYGYRNDGIEKEPEDITNEISFLAFNPIIKIENVSYKITGIIDTKFDYDHFDALNNKDANQLISYMLYEELNETVKFGYHGLAFVQEGFIKQTLTGSGAKKKIGTDTSNSYFALDQDVSYYASVYPNRLYKASHLSQLDAKYYIKGGKTTLNENEFMIEFSRYYEMLDNAIFEKLGDYYTQEKFNQYAPDWFAEVKYGYKDEYSYTLQYIMDNYNPDFDDYLIEIEHWQHPSEMTLEDKAFNLLSYMQQNEQEQSYVNYLAKSLAQISADYQEDFGKYGSQEKYQETLINKAIATGAILDNNNLFSTQFNLRAQQHTSGYNSESMLNLVGVYMLPIEDNQVDASVIIDDSMYQNMDLGEAGDYAFLIAKMPNGSTLTGAIKFTYDVMEENSQYNIRNGVMSTLNMVNSLIETLAQVFLYIGIGFAVFAALMLTNYIGTSIAYKRREIGILRAVGARSSDVFGIFFNESLLIALINFVLATIAALAVVILLNNLLRADYNLLITILNFGIRQIGLMLGISVVVALIASFFPVYKIAKQRPVDAIKK